MKSVSFLEVEQRILHQLAILRSSGSQVSIPRTDFGRIPARPLLEMGQYFLAYRQE
jgi:hypothetical protein